MTYYDFKKQNPGTYTMTETTRITTMHAPKILKLIDLKVIEPKKYIGLHKVYYLFSDDDIKKLMEYKNKTVRKGW